MSYRVLARKYRPEVFEDVIGQEHITRTLAQSVINDRLGHAYIFSGPRGIGKTTTARLLAKVVNCPQVQEKLEAEDLDVEDIRPCNECDSCEQIKESRDVDVIEIDGASNNSVDQIRDLRENVQYAPSHNNKKVYIIDEVHMLSRSAFNALLKTLEEPPDHVLFVFATTEIEQVPDTILSRCQRFDFRLIPQRLIAESLREICDEENIEAEDEALYLIARFAEGSLRDAQSILDQMINYTGAGEQTLTEQLVSDTWGLAPYDELLQYLKAIASHDQQTVIDKLHEHLDSGNDMMGLLSDLTEMMRNLLLLKGHADSDYLRQNLPEDVVDRLETIADNFTDTELSWMFDELIDLHERLRQNGRFQLPLAEVGLIRIIEGRPRYSMGEIIDRLEELESGGDVASPSRSETGTNPPDQSLEQSQNTTSRSPDKEQQTADSQSDRSSENSEQHDSSEVDNESLNTNQSVGETSKNKGTSKKDRTRQGKQDESTESSDSSEAEQSTPESPTPTDPAQKNTGESGTSTTQKSISGTAWKRILPAVPNPSQAYLRSCESVEVKDSTLVITFRGDQWANHVEHLNQDDNRRAIQEAVHEKTGESLEVQIRHIDSDDDTSQSSESPQNERIERSEDSTDSQSNPSKSDGERLLEQTMDVFDVDEDQVEKVDG
ncbi:MAG: DNA polymerase III subunit gamma/tau [bacterium]